MIFGFNISPRQAQLLFSELVTLEEWLASRVLVN